MQEARQVVQGAPRPPVPLPLSLPLLEGRCMSWCRMRARSCKVPPAPKCPDPDPVTLLKNVYELVQEARQVVQGAPCRTVTLTLTLP